MSGARLWLRVEGREGNVKAASAAVEAVASTAADAAFTLPSRPSTRNQSLAPLTVHHGHPPGSVGRSQSCKDMHLWSTRIVRKKVVYPKKSGCRGVNCASRGVNERENWRQSFRTDQETHPGVLYTNFYGTLSLKNNTLGRLLEKVAYLKLEGVGVPTLTDS